MSKYDFRNWLYTNITRDGQPRQGPVQRFKFAPDSLASTLFRPGIQDETAREIQGAGIVPRIAEQFGMTAGLIPAIAAAGSRLLRGAVGATFARRQGEGWWNARNRIANTPLQGEQEAGQWVAQLLSPTFEQNTDGTVKPLGTAKLVISNLIRPTMVFGEQALRYANPWSKPVVQPRSGYIKPQ